MGLGLCQNLPHRAPGQFPGPLVGFLYNIHTLTHTDCIPVSPASYHALNLAFFPIF
jgi:hypothetical protein